jgi:hypothetical protein
MVDVLAVAMIIFFSPVKKRNKKEPESNKRNLLSANGVILKLHNLICSSKNSFHFRDEWRARIKGITKE